MSTAVPCLWAEGSGIQPDKSGTGVSEMAAESLPRNQGGKAHTRIRAARFCRHCKHYLPPIKWCEMCGGAEL
jgi:hypothetical protein